MKKNHHTSQLIVKSNHLIEASYRLDLVEQRVILMAIFLAREHGLGITSDNFITVSASAYAATFGLDMRTAYEQLSQVGASLYERNITLNDIHQPTGKPRKIQARWVSAVGYIPEAALIQLQFSGVIVPYITKLEREFTSYKISMIAKMTSVYAIRLYELLIQWGTIGMRAMSIDELKEILAIEGGYPAIKDFKKRVIDPAVTQINLHSDLRVSYENVKHGKSVIGLNFSFNKKEGFSPKQPIVPIQTNPTIASSPLKLSPAELAKQEIEEAVRRMQLKKAGQTHS